jgi:hypothetical protein
MPNLLAFDLPPAILQHLGWLIAGLIVLVGLVIIGFKDLIRFAPRRVWAISGVCFSESIRRRILWITPIAILGVIVVAQLQKPIDEQDAIRQTTKFCLFATGLVVTISAIILACTSLPREIENRVIFTVVTKPTTRLEIILGKIVGFARVSAAILLIMGLFTWGYLHLRALSLQHDIQDRLNVGAVEAISKPTLQHYVDAGLLNAKSLATPASMNIYARLPREGDPHRYFTSDGMVLIPFVLPPDTLAAADPHSQQYTGPGMVIHVRVGYDAATVPAPATAPSSVEFTGPSPLVSSTQPAGTPKTHSGPPDLQVQIFDSNQNTALTNEINGGKPFTLNSPDGTILNIPVASSAVASLTKLPYIYVALLGATPDVNYWIDSKPAALAVPVTSQSKPQILQPTNPTDPSQPAQFAFLSHQGTYGQQIKGDVPDKASVCVYTFRDVNTASTGAAVPIEMRIGIEHGGDDNEETDVPARVNLAVLNQKTGQLTDAGIVTPENNRTVYATVPTAALAGGNFQVIVRCLSPDQWIGLTPASLSIVQSESSFGLNLVKSLVILWLLAILVIAIAIFCSTFLSWPIAIVLTLVILLGHWGVQELGDAATAGLGRQFVQDFGVRDPAASLALSSTVEQLNKMLNTVSIVLPDISQFSATEDIERGISIPAERLADALAVLLGFGIPLSVLAYVFLKKKEVAP